MRVFNMCSSGLGTRELALISVFSSLWILAQIYLGQVIGAMTQIHGLVNRLVGWMLMFLLAELTARFGRVSIMASVAALATRIIRRSTSLYALSVGLGYALAGLTFDSLYHLFRVKKSGNKNSKSVRSDYFHFIRLWSNSLSPIPDVKILHVGPT